MTQERPKVAPLVRPSTTKPPPPTDIGWVPYAARLRMERDTFAAENERLRTLVRDVLAMHPVRDHACQPSAGEWDHETRKGFRIWVPKPCAERRMLCERAGIETEEDRA